MTGIGSGIHQMIGIVVQYDAETKIRHQEERQYSDKLGADESRVTESPIEGIDAPKVAMLPASPKKDCHGASAPESAHRLVVDRPELLVLDEIDCKDTIAIDILVLGYGSNSATSAPAPNKKRWYIKAFYVRHSTTIKDLAILTAAHLGCPINYLWLQFRSNVFWSDPNGPAHQVAPPADTTLASVSRSTVRWTVSLLTAYSSESLARRILCER